MVSCSKVNDTATNNEGTEFQASNEQSNFNEPLSDSISEPKSLLTLAELLNATDVKLALAKAADEGNMPVLKYWQQQLLMAAEEVNLPEQEKQLIENEQGLKYLAFQGMKTNYQNAFDQAFFEFQDVDAVYAAYPAFKDLHARSRDLVKQRDKLILKVASELTSSGYEGDAIAEAKRQWQNFILNNHDSAPN